MKTIYLILTLFLSAKICFGQTDTTFFNAEWKKCEKTDAKFYRTIVKSKDNFIISDMFANNKPQMIAVCTNSIDPLNKNGNCTYFDEKGNKESQGLYKDSKPTGTWTWYDNDGKDSTVATYRENGTKEYTRFSRLQLEKQKTSNNVYQLADEMPSFPGGLDAMNKFIVKEFNLPKADKKNNVTGTFYVSIIINEDESVSLLEIKKSLSSTLDEEVTRIINKMPKWTPGKIDNKAVKVKTIIPFKVN
ncbi:MAG: hypothetical protein C0448_14600 [Sphingobacteriaceae bacterium]|nr:hypothetical protein [Sphingobacteriaceae bacterium]